MWLVKTSVLSLVPSTDSAVRRDRNKTIHKRLNFVLKI